MIKKISNKINQYYRNVVINSIAASNFMPLIFRKFLYRSYGINTKAKLIRPGCYFGGNKVKIGRGTSINGKCYFENLEKITIGENCNIAMDVLFCTSTHKFGDVNRRAGKPYGKPIIISDGCWIGARTTILPGVTIGEGCIIAAGSVVTKDCEPNSIYMGVPAKRAKKI